MFDEVSASWSQCAVAKLSISRQVLMLFEALQELLLLASERSERDTLRSVQLRIAYILLYIMVRANFVLITRKEGGA